MFVTLLIMAKIFSGEHLYLLRYMYNKYDIYAVFFYQASRAGDIETYSPQTLKTVVSQDVV